MHHYQMSDTHYWAARRNEEDRQAVASADSHAYVARALAYVAGLPQHVVDEYDQALAASMAHDLLTPGHEAAKPRLEAAVAAYWGPYA